jgi:hypothetical protein
MPITSCALAVSRNRSGAHFGLEPREASEKLELGFRACVADPRRAHRLVEKRGTIILAEAGRLGRRVGGTWAEAR